MVRTLVTRWPAWPLDGAKAWALATCRVADLHRYSDDVRAYLVRVGLEAAERRYRELKESLEGKRANLPERERPDSGTGAESRALRGRLTRAWMKNGPR